MGSFRGRQLLKHQLNSLKWYSAKTACTSENATSKYYKSTKKNSKAISFEKKDKENKPDPETLYQNNEEEEITVAHPATLLPTHAPEATKKSSRSTAYSTKQQSKFEDFPIL